MDKPHGPAYNVVLGIVIMLGVVAVIVVLFSMGQPPNYMLTPTPTV